jgi:MFS family permease
MQIPPALKNRKFLLLWLGLMVSVAGTQMQVTAIHWHIRELTGEPDPLALGAIGLARILPVIVFSLFGGAFADTYNRRMILFITQTSMALTALGLAVLTFSGQTQLWHIYLLTALQAIIPNIVSARELPNAFSLNSISGLPGHSGWLSWLWR